ncbi:MAG: hypothetical protein MI723_01710 [Caulobacterales bacterium]|nr:hypothetical protein [Caulobacterales bacterium]
MAAAAACLAAAPALSLEAGTWQRDADLVENGLIRTLDESFQRTRDREGWRDYHDQFVSGLDRFNGLVSPQSLQLMREIGEQLRLNFDTIEQDERWQDASYFIRAKVVFTTFVLGTYAANLDHATWERDAALIEAALMRTIDESFIDTRKREDWVDYQTRFADGMARFDSILEPATVELSREIGVQLRQNFENIENVKRWEDASYFLRSKLIFTAFVLRTYGR